MKRLHGFRFLFCVFFSAALLLCVRWSAARPLEQIQTRFHFIGENRYIPWRQLTWDDFVVNDAQSGLSAETVSYLRFRYQISVDKIKEPGGGEYYTACIKQITFSGGMDKARSWRRSNIKNNADKNNAELLRHEQGHLDLNEIKRRQLQSLPVASLPVGKGATLNEATVDLSKRLGEWFKGEMFVLRTRQMQYDGETNFGMNKTGQKKWSELIGSEIKDTLRD